MAFPACTPSRRTGDRVGRLPADRHSPGCRTASYCRIRQRIVHPLANPGRLAFPKGKCGPPVRPTIWSQITATNALVNESRYSQRIVIPCCGRNCSASSRFFTRFPEPSWCTVITALVKIGPQPAASQPPTIKRKKKKKMTKSPVAKCILAAAVLALMMPGLATAQDVVNSPYVVTGETGTVHIMPTPELSRQIKAEQGARPPAAALS